MKYETSRAITHTAPRIKISEKTRSNISSPIIVIVPVAIPIAKGINNEADIPNLKINGKIISKSKTARLKLRSSRFKISKAPILPPKLQAPINENISAKSTLTAIFKHKQIYFTFTRADLFVGAIADAKKHFLSTAIQTYAFAIHMIVGNTYKTSRNSSLAINKGNK